MELNVCAYLPVTTIAPKSAKYRLLRNVAIRPPTRSRASNTITSIPNCCSCCAAAKPDMPVRNTDATDKNIHVNHLLLLSVYSALFIWHRLPAPITITLPSFFVGIGFKRLKIPKLMKPCRSRYSWIFRTNVASLSNGFSNFFIAFSSVSCVLGSSIHICSKRLRIFKNTRCEARPFFTISGKLAASPDVNFSNGNLK